jgi:hypothetical protein
MSTTNPTSETKKLNLNTDQGSILVSTSCASRTSAARGCWAGLGAGWATGWRSVVAGLFLTFTAGLPRPIAPPGFLVALGFGFFIRPGLVNGLVSFDFTFSKSTDGGGSWTDGVVGTWPPTCVAGSAAAPRAPTDPDVSGEPDGE